MATIANLDINLGARVAGFEKGMKNARTAVTQLQSVTGSVSGKLASFARGMAVAAGAALAANFGIRSIATQMERIDVLAKSSDTLGIATEDMQGLAHAANLAGVSSETLGKSLFRMNKVVAEGAGGDKNVRETFSALGIDLKKFIDLKPADQFAKVADSLADVSNVQERARLAQEIFGKAAQELIPLLTEGGAGIVNAGKDIDAFGLALSRVDAAHVEAANDSITRMQLLFSSVAQKIAVELSPIITGLVNWFIDGAAEGMKFGEIIEAAMEGVKFAVASAANSWAVWGAPIKLIGAAVSGMVSLITGALAQLNEAAKKITGEGFDKTDFAAKISAATGKLSKELGKNAIDNFVKGVTLETFNDVLRSIDKAASAGVESRGFGALDFMEDEEKKKAGKAGKLGAAGGGAGRHGFERPAALEFGTSAAASAIAKGGGGLMKLEGIAALQLKAMDKTSEILLRLWKERDGGDVLRVGLLGNA